MSCDHFRALRVTLSRHLQFVLRLRAFSRRPRIQNSWNADSTGLGRVAVRQARFITTKGLNQSSSEVSDDPMHEKAESQARDPAPTPQPSTASSNSIQTALKELISLSQDPDMVDEEEGADGSFSRSAGLSSKESGKVVADPKRIYILGVGSVGGFIAHSLRGIADPPPITLLFHAKGTFRSWERAGQAIHLTTGELVERRGGFKVERSWDLRSSTKSLPHSAADEEPILNLIVSVKGFHTVEALKGVLHRLRPESTICFMQNGMGILDEVNEKLYPDPVTRPRYLQGVISHGLTILDKFKVEHRGQGTIALSISQVPGKVDVIEDENSGEPQKVNRATWNRSSRYMLRTLTRADVLSVIGVSPHDLLIFQLEKLAVNCVINPLTAIFGCQNGDLLLNKHARAVMRLLLAEISLVIRKLPELQTRFPSATTSRAPSTSQGSSITDEGVSPYIANKFSAERLEYATISVMQQTATNRSSMLQDVEAGPKCEIKYLNDYIVRRGEELGIKCVMNFMVSQMVEARSMMIKKRADGRLPSEKWADLSNEVKQKLIETYTSENQ